MSQMRRATRLSASPHGNTRKVERSGARSMSDSSMRTKPSIDEPSNMMSPASAFSNCDAGTSTFLLMPRMSVNCRRRKRTWCCLASARMSLAVAPLTSGRVERVCRGTWRIVLGGGGKGEEERGRVKPGESPSPLVPWQADCDWVRCPELGVEHHEGQRYHDEKAEVRHTRDLGARGGAPHERRGCRRIAGR